MLAGRRHHVTEASNTLQREMPMEGNESLLEVHQLKKEQRYLNRFAD